MQMNMCKELCKHFGYCGGCDFQNLEYEEQLRQKEAEILKLYKDIIPFPISIIPSPTIWHYRNKIDPVFAPEHFDVPPPPDTPRKTVLGFKKNRKWYATFQLEECLIGPEEVPELINIIRNWYVKHGYEAYNRRTGKGVLKALLFRKAKKTNDKMVCIITRDLNLHWDDLIEALSKNLNCKSVYSGLLNRPVDISLAEHWQLLYGEPHITELITIKDKGEIKTWQFNISPASFFQTNTLAAELMFQKIYDWVSTIAPEIVFDLYGGMGTIGIVISPLAKVIYSVDCVPSAIDDGIKNMKVNNISNIQFTLSTVRKFLSERVVGKNINLPKDALVIVDPPREGLTPKIVKKLLEWQPRNIIYVSCNPKIFSQELPLLKEKYKVSDSQAYDLFPHTRHFELLTLLTAK